MKNKITGQQIDAYYIDSKKVTHLRKKKMWYGLKIMESKLISNCKNKRILVDF